MTRICAWCLTLMDGSDAEGSTPTHGMCQSCRARIEREWELIRAGIRPKLTSRERVAACWRGLRRRLILVLGRLSRLRRS
ncbi:MAG: hypothetical protein ACOYXU_05705 [Nitrospirota bacterium]